MISIKETDLYNQVIKELNYSFGNVFIFEGFVISEINLGINLNWDEHAKVIVNDVSRFIGSNGKDIVYISHRINSYSVVASDWLKFFNNSFNLKGYYIVSEDKIRVLSSVIENLFFNNKIKRFNNLNTAINWIKIGID
ncbi:hypothetical protein QLS71_013205 [Mariniflexile litorale]|uniref:STAS/SEC14 domain-containing protein n=1 Tax=Mariniflexile litorale TaxID=3045158 RepID=A0AAU7ECJ2_9FLAO|nr:hypothetical protein [Mariniflexile sp. KMM 9835]MDQ8212184.1 hypothetical protein [Mariniflexile sp. KMM 9835]